MSVTESRPDQPAAIAVEEPATGRTLREVPALDAAAVAALAARARAAQPAWAAMGIEARAQVFKRAQKWLIANADRVRQTICSETGKTYDDAQLEVSVQAASFAFWAKAAKGYLADEAFRSRSPLALGRRVVVRYEPLGLIGVIGPWNYPLVNAFGDCVPALMAGNAVLLKPSEVTPLTALLVEEMLRDCGMPADVFAVATGAGETGGAVVDEADLVMFTGSTRTGKLVMQRGAETMTPVSLELGGKDPMIVCADADLERAANTAVFAGMNNAGQVCISIERVYVEAPVHDAFVGKVEAIVAGLRQGKPGGPGEVEVGAVTHPPQLDIIAGHVEDAKAKGATVLTGGRPGAGPGRFWEPTVITGVDHGMTCMQEETFGPTLPIMRVADVDEAVRLANDSVYGLQASVFTKDLEKGEAIARRLQCGAVVVNDAQVNYAVFDAPMGGWKTSGVGSRHGASGIRKYCHTQSIVVIGLALHKELHHFPLTTRGSKLMSGLVAKLYGR